MSRLEQEILDEAIRMADRNSLSETVLIDIVWETTGSSYEIAEEAVKEAKAKVKATPPESLFTGFKKAGMILFLSGIAVSIYSYSYVRCRQVIENNVFDFKYFQAIEREREAVEWRFYEAEKKHHQRKEREIEQKLQRDVETAFQSYLNLHGTGLKSLGCDWTNCEAFDEVSREHLAFGCYASDIDSNPIYCRKKIAKDNHERIR